MSRSVVFWIGLQAAIAVAHAQAGLAGGAEDANVQKADGIWTVKLAPKGLGVSAMHYYVITDSGGVKIVDPATQTVIPGKSAPGKLEFALPADDKLATTTVTLRKGGVATVGDDRLSYTASALPSLWLCANHAPKSHVANTETEMRTLSKEHNCDGWHRLKIDVVAENSTSVNSSVADTLKAKPPA